jgi:hypothetical protein
VEEYLVIKDFKVCHPGNLFPWSLCERRFALLHPSLFEKYKNDKKNNPDIEDEYYIWDLLDENGIEESAYGFDHTRWDVSQEIPSIILSLDKSEQQTISNFSILALNGGSYIDTDLLMAMDRFFVLIIHQHSARGTLGIWDINLKDWCFLNREDYFCIDQIDYYPSKDEFRGTFAYHQAHSPIWGKGDFVIDRHRIFGTKTSRCISWNADYTGPSPEVRGLGSFFDFER